MCNGEALDVEADSPPPRPVAAPMTPERKIKHEKFEQDYATFLLKSHAWSKSLRANTTVALAIRSCSFLFAIAEPDSKSGYERFRADGCCYLTFRVSHL